MTTVQISGLLDGRRGGGRGVIRKDVENAFANVEDPLSEPAAGDL